MVSVYIDDVIGTSVDNIPVSLIGSKNVSFLAYITELSDSIVLSDNKLNYSLSFLNKSSCSETSYVVVHGYSGELTKITINNETTYDVVKIASKVYSYKEPKVFIPSIKFSFDECANTQYRGMYLHSNYITSIDDNVLKIRVNGMNILDTEIVADKVISVGNSKYLVLYSGTLSIITREGNSIINREILKYSNVIDIIQDKNNEDVLVFTEYSFILIKNIGEPYEEEKLELHNYGTEIGYDYYIGDGFKPRKLIDRPRNTEVFGKTKEKLSVLILEPERVNFSEPDILDVYRNTLDVIKYDNPTKTIRLSTQLGNENERKL